MYHYFHYRRPEDVGFVKYLSETNVYNYFPYTASNPIRSENARFEGITPRRRPWTECMCV